MKITDIDFKSADHVIEEIKNMNVKGGSPFGRAAAWAFKLVSLQEEFDSKEALIERYHEVAGQMIALKPTMGTIYNTYVFIQEVIAYEKNGTVEELKEKVVAVSDAIINYSFDAVDKLAEYGANLIKNGAVIMMHSYSSTLMGIFIHAAESGKKFRVICTESRPLRESRVAVRILQQLGLEVTYITDASIYEFMPQADLIIMGADSLSFNGAVANKMGTALISKLAGSCKIPVYIASELYKLDMRTQNGYPIQLERRTKDEILSEGDFESLERIDVINQFFDLTPAQDITALVCEFGCIHPASVGTYWTKLKEEIKEGMN